MMSKTQIRVGKGTMEKFVEDYTEINMTDGCSVKASQLFPMDMADKVSNTEFTMIYEYIIYFQESLFKKKEEKLDMKDEEVKELTNKKEPKLML